VLAPARLFVSPRSQGRVPPGRRRGRNPGRGSKGRDCPLVEAAADQRSGPGTELPWSWAPRAAL